MLEDGHLGRPHSKLHAVFVEIPRRLPGGDPGPFPLNEPLANSLVYFLVDNAFYLVVAVTHI